MTLLLAAHGTRDPVGAAVLRRLAATVQRRCPQPVRLSFVDVLAPRVPEALAAAPGRAVVVPAFLAAGYHVRVDLPAQVAAAGRSDVTVAEPLGPDPALAGVLAARLAAAGWSPGDAVVLGAAGSSDPTALADVHTAARALGARLGSRVRVGYLATARPRVADVVAGLRAAGEPRVAVAAWLLAPGLFFRMLDAAGADVVANPLGVHPAVVDLVLARCRAAVHAGRPVSA